MPGNFCAVIPIIGRPTRISSQPGGRPKKSRRISPRNGGYDFAADPASSGLDRPIFWTPQADPAALLLTQGPSPAEGLSVSAEDLRAITLVEHAATAIRIALDGRPFDIAFDDVAKRPPLAAVIMLDDMTPDRLVALSRFWNAIASKQVPPDPRTTDQRRQRARQMLRAIDARAHGATYRMIAEGLFPRHEIDPAAWVGTAIRETTIRLVRDGLKLVHGGYRSLLRRPRRDR